MTLQKKRLILDKVAHNSFYVLSIFACLSLAFFFFILLSKSIPIIQSNNIFTLLSSSNWKPIENLFGFLPFILSTFWVTCIAIIIAVPICLFASIYLTEYASLKIKNRILPIIDILSGLPSVIFGIWGVLAIVPFVEELANVFSVKTQGYSI